MYVISVCIYFFTIVGAGSAILLDYMYNEHYELLYKFFLAIGVIGVVIYAFGIAFAKRRTK